MNKMVKIAIVAVLVVVVGVVIVLKKGQSDSEPAITDSAAVETSGDVESGKVRESKSLPLMVDLGAGKCIPCKMMAPLLEELKAEYTGRLKVEFIDVWKNPNEAKKYGIKIIPTQIFFDASGKELFRHEGFFSKEEILAKWGELGVDIEVKRD